MDNVWKPRGALKSQKPDSNGAVLRQYPILGVVKDNVDPTRSGRIRVYVSALGGKDPDDEKNWTPVLYMSPFFGQTDSSGGNTDYGSYKSNPASYGVWNSPPDIGTIVVCLFINGDPNFGFYIGSIPDAEALRMVPAMGANFTTEDVIFTGSEAGKYGGATRVPVTNMNTNNSNETDNPTFLTSPKPVHSFQASIMFQQGILRDPIRGPISSSAQRESPSRVGWGVSTPGRPIYEGGFTDETIADAADKSGQQSSLKVVSRRGGHSIVLDDGDLIGQDNLVRIRTSLGHQILMSDDGQTLMILHSNGQSYIELGKEGTIDMYSTNSVNIRTQGDLNLHADNNVNIQAKNDININADNNININATNDFNQLTVRNQTVEVLGKFTTKVDGAMSMGSAGDASYASGATTYINGSVINLNTGATSTTPQAVKPIPLVAQTDTLFSAGKGWAAAPGKLLTIVSRAPAHAPWANAGQGTDVKVDLDADAVFPQNASPELESTIQLASTTNDYTPITVSGASTVPPVEATSKALDKNSTSALVSAAAANAANGPAAAAVKAGAGTISDVTGAVQGVAIGIPGLSASALQNAGNLKPGSADLVNSLVQSGKTIEQAMPSNLFTGKNGANNLTSLVSNPSAQANALVTNMQQAQTLLTKTGVMTGKEGPGAVAGPVLASTLNGIGPAVDAIKNAGLPNNPIANNIGGAADGVMKSMASGNFAANLSQNVTSGLSGISNSIKSMGQGLGGIIESTKGVAASAFSAITNSFKSFQAGIPQNLKAIAEKNQKESSGGTTLPDNVNPLAGLTKEQLDKLGNADPTDPFIRSRLGLPALAGTTLPSAASLASGVANMPGGSKTIASVVNNLPNATNLVPGTPGVKSLIDNAVTATNNNVNTLSALTSSFGVPGPSSAAISGVTASIKNLEKGSDSLNALAAAGLNPSAASELNSKIASISSGGPVDIKMPTVALNTNNRSSLSNALNSLLPSGVPTPNFSGISGQSKTTTEAQQQNTAENAQKIEELNKQYDEQKKVIEKAEDNYFKVKASVPSGDPAVQAARQAWDDATKKQSEISQEIAKLRGFNFNLSGLSGLQNQGKSLEASGQRFEKFLQTNPVTGEVGKGYNGPPSNNYAGG